MEQNAANEAMAHMLDERDDLDNELHFAFQLNPGVFLNSGPIDSRPNTSHFSLDNSHYPDERSSSHRNVLLPILGYPGHNGHVVCSGDVRSPY